MKSAVHRCGRRSTPAHAIAHFSIGRGSQALRSAGNPLREREFRLSGHGRNSTHAMKSKFRDTSPQDAPAIAAFLQRAFDSDPGLPLTELRHLHWKCWEPRSDWPGSRGYAMTGEDAIVAHGAVVPLSFVNARQRLTIAHVIDWAADPKSIGSGVTLMKQIARMVDAVLAVGGSEMTQKVLPALGFKICGEVTKYARPLRPLRRFADQKRSPRLWAQFARSLLWTLQAPSVETHGWTANRIAPEQLAVKEMRWPRPGAGTGIFERTVESVAYFQRCPAVPMELYSVAKDGSDRGYFLLAQAPGQTRIADFYYDSEDREGWRALVQLAVLQARLNPAAAEVVSVGSDPSTRQALEDCGFHARGNWPLRLLPGRDVELPTGAIRFQMIDNDFAYLHANRSEYWA